jgi:hypothetical protein
MNFFQNKFDKKIIKSKVPWVDKYRPKKLNDIVQQDEIKEILKKSLIIGNIPHLLFDILLRLLLLRCTSLSRVVSFKTPRF